MEPVSCPELFELSTESGFNLGVAYCHGNYFLEGLLLHLMVNDIWKT